MMGFDVYGPTRHIRASNIDDGDEPKYDILAMPGTLGLRCPLLEMLNQRFYDSTTLRFADGYVHSLRDELVRLQQAYRVKREPELIKSQCVRARDPEVRRAIVQRVLETDTTYRALEDFRLLCEEAIMAEMDVQCEGD